MGPFRVGERIASNDKKLLIVVEYALQPTLQLGYANNLLMNWYYIHGHGKKKQITRKFLVQVVKVQSFQICKWCENCHDLAIRSTHCRSVHSFDLLSL